MYEWIYAVQHLIDWIDTHALEKPTLMEISKQVGYSPYYCSEQFHRVAGMTIKAYVSKRRLSMAAVAIRDGDQSLLEIALDYGFSSQAALTRAFEQEFGITPAQYRKNPVPIPILTKKSVLLPSHYNSKGEMDMSKIVLPSCRVEYIPAHKYLGVYGKTKTGNGDIWAGHDCELVTGIVSSMSPAKCHRVVTPHTAGWSWEGQKRTYFYGSGVELDYDGEIPEGFELRGEFPGSYYLVFSHPPFDYLADNAEVTKRVEDLAWNFDPAEMGYEWNEKQCQDYQRHYPEVLGYQVLRPVKAI